MLNLRCPITYTSDEKAHIKALLNKKDATGNRLSTKGLWAGDKDTKKLKNKISRATVNRQKCRCAYCECILDKSCEIEHFAPKSEHRQFTFERFNLFTACSRCNCRGVKGTKDTIIPPVKTKYRSNTFKIVHPYLDDPDQHIKFRDSKRIAFDKGKCTKLGLDTIEFFKWDATDARLNRAKNADIKLTRTDLRKLALQIISYQP